MKTRPGFNKYSIQVSLRHLGVKTSAGSELSRQLKLLALENFCDVEIEEIAVKDGLHAAGHDGNDIVEA